MTVDNGPRAGRRVFYLVAPLALVATAAAIGAALLWTPPQAPKSPQQGAAPVVGVADLIATDERVYVEAYGTVVASRDIRVQSEVGGRVVEMHPGLQPGGLIRADQMLFLIDPADYEIAVKQAEADRRVADLQVEQLRASVEALRSQAQQIEAELELLQWNADRLAALFAEQRAAETEAREARSKLAAQLAALASLRARVVEEEQAVAGAIAQTSVLENRLAAANLALARTRVVAPFDAIVIDESVELGQFVAPQNTVATLAATDEFWVEAAVPMSRLKDIRFAVEGELNPSAVTVSLGGDADAIERKGTALRALADLDPQGRMARVLVVIHDPLSLRDTAASGSNRILLGSYVRMAFDAGVVERVYVIPRSALRENDRVWVRDADGRLRTQEVRVVWRRQDDVLVRGDFAPGVRLVTTFLASVVPGMPLDVRLAPAEPDRREPVSQVSPMMTQP